MLGGWPHGAAAPGEAACSTPTSPAKASRRDHSQTTPRSAGHGAGGDAGGGAQQHAPPRLRVPAAVDASAADQPSTGLTPLAARMRLGAPTFSSLHDPQPQQYSQAAPPQAPRAAAAAAAAAPAAAPSYYPYGYQAAAATATAYTPLAAGASAVQPGPSSGAAAPAPLSAVSQAYALPSSGTAHHQANATYRNPGSYLQAARAAAAAAAATAAAVVPPARADPSWPFLPGLSVVETTTTASNAAPARPPPLAIPPAHLARAAPPSAAAPPTTPSPTTPPPQQAAASGSPTPWPPPPRPGMPPAAALRTLGHLLTSYEKGEVLAFPEVWFAGRSLNPKIRGSAASGLPNAGYDDARGDYLAVPGDHVAYRYEVLGPLGRGSFGQVVKALDHATGAALALKIIRNRSRFARQAATEAGILAALAEADPGGAAGVVRMAHSFAFRGHHCITFELLGANLYEHLRGGGFAGVPPPLARRVAAQVLATLAFLGAHGLVHCDVKPENILLVGRGASAVKLIDFGSSCYADRRVYTYIQSRFYRAPEVVLGMPYGPPIDVWSLACVVAELLTGSPLFPGEDEADQLARVAQVLGPPPLAMLAQGTRSKTFFDVATGAPTAAGAGRPDSRGRPRRAGTRSLGTALGGRADAALLDFLARCLRWDPAERLTPAQALAHPWVAGAAAGAAAAAAATHHLHAAQAHYQHGQQLRLGPLGGAALAHAHQAPWK